MVMFVADVVDAVADVDIFVVITVVSCDQSRRRNSVTLVMTWLPVPVVVLGRNYQKYQYYLGEVS